MIKNRAVFLDRDGTIIDDRGYLKHPDEVYIFPQSKESLRLLQKYFLLIIITNQSGIGKGVTTEAEVEAVNRFLIAELKNEGIEIDAIYVCPHKKEDNCDCYKPKPHFIFEAEKRFSIDLSASFMIGDHPSDVYCGINAGVTPLYVLSGHGNKHVSELNCEVGIFDGIAEASDYILNNIKKQ